MRRRKETQSPVILQVIQFDVQPVLIHQHPVKPEPDQCVGSGIHGGVCGGNAIEIYIGSADIQDSVAGEKLLQVVAHNECAETLDAEIKE